MTDLKDDTEYTHTPNNRSDWRESYYFNWVDLESGISGFSTIGLLPNVQKREFVFALFYDDKREVYFVEPEGEVPRDFHGSLSDGVLLFEVVKPLKEWVIKYQGKDLTVELNWRGRFPPFDFGSGSGTSWDGHFEQSGHVTGRVDLPDGQIILLEGLGERDKSWGSRDWHIESWYALHAQFEDVSIGLRRDMVDGEPHASGGISTAEGHVLITRVGLETKYMEGKIGMPIGARTHVYGEDGSCYTLKSSMISPTSFVRFERKFPGGQTELFEEMATHECEELGESGTGLIEWLYTHHD